MPKRYRSRRWPVLLAFFFSGEAVFIVLGLYAILLHTFVGLVMVLAANVALAVLFLLVTRALRKEMDYIFETDGKAWIRRFDNETDIRMTRFDVARITRNGFAVEVESRDGRFILTPDCSGYDRLRDLIETWIDDNNASGDMTAKTTTAGTTS